MSVSSDRVHAVNAMVEASEGDLDLLVAVDHLEAPAALDEDHLALAEALRGLDSYEICEVLLTWEYCPVHRCDIEACLDDGYHR
jgi:hypothetical protein